MSRWGVYDDDDHRVVYILRTQDNISQLWQLITLGKLPKMSNLYIVSFDSSMKRIV